LSGDLAWLGTENAKPFAARVSRIWHFAGSVNFTLPLPVIQGINVDGARRVLEFTEKCREANPNFEALCHVSTAYVAGRRPGVVQDGELRKQPSFRNAYEQTKYESELLVSAASKRIPTIIVRPSIVAGLTVDGRPTKSNPLDLVMRKLIARGVRWAVADKRARLDFVEPRAVAEAIWLAAHEPALLGSAIHLCAGAEQDISVVEVGELVKELLGVKISFLPTFLYPLVIEPLLRVYKGDPSGARRHFFFAYGRYFENGPAFEARKIKQIMTDNGCVWPSAEHVARAAFSTIETTRRNTRIGANNVV